ncbi:hypothetical protein GCM10010307_34300 [Streptomyces vastus]|uniref:Uncharacterized protein n=1 Tax=Streptomyces vastus TaxID=285451 RepID=A0ABP6D6E7_9ACTN
MDVGVDAAVASDADLGVLPVSAAVPVVRLSSAEVSAEDPAMSPFSVVLSFPAPSHAPETEFVTVPPCRTFNSNCPT